MTVVSHIIIVLSSEQLTRLYFSKTCISILIYIYVYIHIPILEPLLLNFIFHTVDVCALFNVDVQYQSSSSSSHILILSS